MNPYQLFNKSAVLACIGTIVLSNCAAPVSQQEMARATQGYVEDTNKLFVVDCLLPGQVRRLGTQLTYLSQRRPIRTTAADCEIRGGEYVAYDRANSASALKVWLPQAQSGDATAQLYVGQIFEKGLGQAVDYQAAFQWYQKAAAQGNSEAQLNLGHLYEKGLGTAKDSQLAMQWYRKASGLDGAGLQFAPAMEAKAIQTSSASARQSDEVKALKQEAESLRAQLNATRQQLIDQQDSLRKAQDELEATREKARRLQSSTVPQGGEMEAMQRELREKESRLKQQQAKVSDMMAAMNRDRQAARRELENARKEAAQGRKVSSKSTPEPVAASSATEEALNEKISAYQRKSSELTHWLTSSNQMPDPQARSRIDARKLELQADAREIAVLRDKLEKQSRSSGPQLASGGPVIEILEPPLTMTRGMPSIQISGSGAGKMLKGKVTSPIGLEKLLVDQQPVAIGGDGYFQVPLKLEDESKPIEILATDTRNGQSRLSVSVTTPPGAGPEPVRESSSVGSGASAQGIDFGHFYALIIGNSDYAAYPKLKTPKADAQSMDVILRERYGFTTKLLIDANRHAIMSALNELNKKLTDRDNLIIYFAGHGEIDPASQSAYWLPTDAEAGNSANWISSQSITELLGIMKAKHILVVADSCYAGALTGSAVARLPDGMDESKRNRWLQVMNSRQARTVLTSGGVKPVMDEGGGDHSVFAKALLSVLRSNQRVLEDYDLFRGVSAQVRASSLSAGFEQAPQYAPLQHAGHEGSPFFLVPRV